VEDGKTMDGYLKDLEGMYPPEELQPYREKLGYLFRSTGEAAAGVDTSVEQGDLSPFTGFRQWFATALEESRALWSEAMSYLGGFGGGFDSHIEQGKELAERIHGL
jgi:hypothetical protein